MGVGGSSQDQNGYHNDSSTGITGTMPIAPDGYQNAWTNILNMNGQTPGQQAAYNYYKDQLDHGGGLFDWQNQAMAQEFYRAPYQVSQQPNVAAQSISAPTISAQTGAAGMDAYQNPYTNQVVNATLANYDQNTANQLNALRASRDASSAFGDRANLADSQFLNQSDLNRTQLQSGLLDTAFNTAAGYGQQDANRFLAADQANATNALTAGQINAANSLNAQQFNNNLNAQNQQFNVNAQYQGLDRNLNALNQLGQNYVTQNQISGNDANMVANLGGTNFNQMLSGLAAGNPLFGSATLASGQSQGASSSHSSGKNGGFSI